MFDEEKIKIFLEKIIFETENETERNKLIGELTKELHKNPRVKKHFDSQSIKKMLNPYIWDTIAVKSKKDYIDRAFEAIKNQFKTLDKWWILIPIINLKITYPRTINVGNVKFFNFNENRKKEYKSHIKRLIFNNVHYNKKQKKDIYDQLIEELIKQTDKRACALVLEEGTSENATLKGYEDVQTSLAVLKLYRSSNVDFFRTYFNISGELIPSNFRYTFLYNNSWTVTNTNLERIGYLAEYEINKTLLKTMKKLEFETINQMLLNQNQNELESVLINSIRMFSEANDVEITTKTEEDKSIYKSISMNDRLIKLFIALESFLIYGDSEQLNNNVAERCSFIMGNTYLKRKAIKIFVKDMYRHRSSHVHHGKSELNGSELNSFIILVQNCIIKTITIIRNNKLNSRDDLREWFEKVKLT